MVESECSIELDYVRSQAEGLKLRTNAILYTLLDRGVCLVGYVSSELSVSALSSPRTAE